MLATKAAKVEVLVYYLAVVKCARYFARLLPVFFLPVPIHTHVARSRPLFLSRVPNRRVLSGPTNVYRHGEEHKPMPSPAQPLIALFRIIVQAGVTALLITSAALPMPAQNSVPPTAVQAARTPEFARRLAPPASRPISRPNPAPVRQGSRNGPPQSGPIYDNGPINGNTDAWTINFGYVVSDTITIVDATSVTGMNFGAWLFSGDTLESAEISITSEPNGGTVYFDQFVYNFTQTGCALNQYGYNVCTEASGSFNSPTLQPGTYWVNLQNASVPSGDPVYWDENSGVGCGSSGCPSQAYETAVGTIPSESFTMLGGNPPPPSCFESQGNLQIIHDFTQQQTGGVFETSGVTIDKAGNLYGTTYNGGDNSSGLAFKLARFAGWVLDPLFSFSGGYSGGAPGGMIVGPNGSLYGGAEGGIQNCGSDGSQYCGLVFNLTPQPRACLTALCSWNESVPYRFSGEIDGSGVINVSASDQEGNLYGTTSGGGLHAAGTVFELMPSGGGWTKTILYTFTGGSDGGAPTQVLVGNDGNLYGVANGVHFQPGVVFQLTPSGGRWTESVLHTFTTEGTPSSLVQDSAGNLYGIASSFPNAIIFMLEKTNSGWTISEYFVRHDGEFDVLNNLAIDAAGKLYGTGFGGTNFAGSFGKTSPDGQLSYYSYIFKAWNDSDGWHYQDLDFLDNQYFPAGGSLGLDTRGNLYGTTSGCGAYGDGTVWQLSP